MFRAATLSVLFILVLAAPAAAQGGAAPGGPGEKAVWTEADKDGFGTATSLRSRTWLTLDDGRLTEVYYPDLGTPASRELQLVVSDGRTFSEREQDSTRQRVRLLDSKSLSYRQVNTDRDGLYRIVKTYTTDPARSSVLVQVEFRSLTKRKLDLYVLHDPALSNNGDDDSGASRAGGLVAWDDSAASALLTDARFQRSSSGFLGTSDGWTDLAADNRMDRHHDVATNGNVVQMARTNLDGKRHREMTLALGFGADRDEAVATARASLERGFAGAARAYARGWHDYVGELKPRPASARAYGPAYWVSAMVLAASEDKLNRGASIASPSMPWAWGLLTIERPSAAYHLVWPRDLYQVASAQIALGDSAAAERSLDFAFERMQKPDGSFPQNTRVDGAENWTNLQLDEVALPIVLAWQLNRSDAPTYSEHVKKAADFIAANGPYTPQERWENQSGWSPGTIAAEIAGLICAADIARRNGDVASAQRWETVADEWQSQVEAWTATSNGPYDPKPYYLRLTKPEQPAPAPPANPDPNAGTTYSIGDGGPSAADQRTVVDPSFLELVRLGVKRHDDQTVLNTLQVVDKQLGVDTPNGRFWHRFNFDGYGETRAGGPWDLSDPGSFRTIGRIWPIFAGERGEYELLAGQRRAAAGRLASIAGAANEGWMIPEQVWDQNPPSGQPGFARGEGTFSATPLAWSHAQFIRLAWSLDAGRPVEQPRVVACRYAVTC
jgi:glucoamylase